MGNDNVLVWKDSFGNSPAALIEFYSALRAYLGGRYIEHIVIRQNKYFCG